LVDSSWERRESPALRTPPSRRPWDARTTSEEGNLPATSSCGVRMRSEGESFAPSGSAHVSSSSSSQPVIGATGNRFVALPASGVPKSGDLQRFTFWCTCSTRGNALMALAWLAARSSRKGWATSMPCCLYGSSAGSEGNAGARGFKTAGRSGGRGSGARGLCSRVIVVSCRSR